MISSAKSPTKSKRGVSGFSVTASIKPPRVDLHMGLIFICLITAAGLLVLVVVTHSGHESHQRSLTQRPHNTQEAYISNLPDWMIKIDTQSPVYALNQELSEAHSICWEAFDPHNGMETKTLSGKLAESFIDHILKGEPERLFSKFVVHSSVFGWISPLALELCTIPLGGSHSLGWLLSSGTNGGISNYYPDKVQQIQHWKRINHRVQTMLRLGLLGYDKSPDKITNSGAYIHRVSTMVYSVENFIYTLSRTFNHIPDMECGNHPLLDSAEGDIQFVSAEQFDSDILETIGMGFAEYSAAFQKLAGVDVHEASTAPRAKLRSLKYTRFAKELLSTFHEDALRHYIAHSIFYSLYCSTDAQSVAMMEGKRPLVPWHLRTRIDYSDVYARGHVCNSVIPLIFSRHLGMIWCSTRSKDYLRLSHLVYEFKDWVSGKTHWFPSEIRVHSCLDILDHVNKFVEPFGIGKFYRKHGGPMSSAGMELFCELQHFIRIRKIQLRLLDNDTKPVYPLCEYPFWSNSTGLRAIPGGVLVIPTGWLSDYAEPTDSDPYTDQSEFGGEKLGEIPLHFAHLFHLRQFLLSVSIHPPTVLLEPSMFLRLIDHTTNTIHGSFGKSTRNSQLREGENLMLWQCAISWINSTQSALVDTLAEISRTSQFLSDPCKTVSEWQFAIEKLVTPIYYDHGIGGVGSSEGIPSIGIADGDSLPKRLIVEIFDDVKTQLKLSCSH